MKIEMTIIRRNKNRDIIKKNASGIGSYQIDQTSVINPKVFDHLATGQEVFLQKIYNIFIIQPNDFNLYLTKTKYIRTNKFATKLLHKNIKKNDSD
jgi:hypothetical protein